MLLSCSDSGHKKTNKLCISSLVVQADPDDLERVQKEIESMPGSEVMGRSEQGKLVVVLDLPDNRIAADCITQIQTLDGVLSATLIYQYDDHEPQLEESA